MDRYLLKLKIYKDSIQYTYSPLKYNSKFSFRNFKTKKNDTYNSQRCSTSRAISNIKEYCLCNDFDYFFTLTLKSKKRNDVFYSSNKIINAIKYYQKKHHNFKYIYVFEKQKKGGIHIHGFFSGFDDLYLNAYSHLESKYFKKIGFHNLQPVEKVNPFYLIKYISKQPIKELKHRYYRSRNLKKADVTYLHCNFDEFQNFSFTFNNGCYKMCTIKI